jgi:hypothetical protein
MDFPGWSSIISSFNILLLVVPAAFVVGVVLFVAAILNKQKDFRPQTRWMCVCFGAFAMLWGCCGCLGLVPQAITNISFRKMNPADVTSLEITAIERENGSPDLGKKFKIDDRDSIARGLKLLEQNRAYSKQHEHFTDGYFVTAKTAQRSYSFYVYKKSHRTNRELDVAVVVLVPNAGSAFQSVSSGYECPEFVKWLDDEVKAHR